MNQRPYYLHIKITITKQSEKLINEVASWQLPLKGAHQPQRE